MREHFSKNYDYVINVNRKKVYRRISKSYICVRDLFTKRRMKGPVFKTNQFQDQRNTGQTDKDWIL